LNRKWFVIFTQSGKEKRVKEVLEHCFPSHEVKPLVPARKLKERKGGIERTVIRTLFPGYVFIRAHMKSETYRRIKQIPSIVDLLKADCEPAEVPDEEMRPILRLTRDSEIIEFSRGIKVGTKVKIIDGPLKDLQGYIIDVDRRKGRAKVALELLGQGKKVELGLIVLERYDSIVNS
jgi:transcriptional antiterminator NusG